MPPCAEVNAGGAARAEDIINNNKVSLLRGLCRIENSSLHLTLQKGTLLDVWLTIWAWQVYKSEKELTEDVVAIDGIVYSIEVCTIYFS